MKGIVRRQMGNNVTSRWEKRNIVVEEQKRRGDCDFEDDKAVQA